MAQMHGEIKAEIVGMNVTLQGVLYEDKKRNGRIEKMEAWADERVEAEIKTTARAEQRAQDKALLLSLPARLNDWKIVLLPVLALGLMIGKFGLSGLWGWFL